MKYIPILLMLPFSILIAEAQKNDPHEIISRKWKVNKEAMWPVMEKMLNERKEVSSLNDENRIVAIQTAIDKIASNTFEYKPDGTLITTTSKEKMKGKWRFNKEFTEIIIKYGENPDKTYKVIELKKDALHLTVDDKSLFLIPFE